MTQAKAASKEEFVEEKSGSSNKLLLILIGVVVILLAVVGVLLFVVIQPGQTKEVSQPQFIANMNELVLRPEDMTVAYRIQPGSDTRVTNEQVVGVMGAESGKPFIQATNRVDGWDLFMERVNANDIAPESYRSRVEVYQTADGASTALSEDYFWAYTDPDKAPDEFLDKSCNVGQECLLFKYNDAKPGSGAVRERYDVAFRYQNTLVWIFIKGTGGEVSEQLALDTAVGILDEIKALEQ